MTVHLLKNRSDDADLGRPDPYEQQIKDSVFVPILQYVSVNLDGLTETLQNQDFDATIVTSQRAVDVLKQGLTAVSTAKEILGKPVYTVGPTTAQRLKLAGFENVIGETSGTGLKLAENMVTELDSKKKFIFFAGEVHRPQLPERLRTAGHTVTTQIVYKTEPLDFLPSLRTSMKPNDWIVFFSPSFSDEILPLLDGTIKVAAIGPTTRDHLAKNNIRVDALAQSPTAESLLEAINAV